jgi:hypothetical protein
MTTLTFSDWRALCFELNQWVIELAASHPNLSQAGIAKIVAITDRADTALAQSEPEEAKGDERSANLDDKNREAVYAAVAEALGDAYDCLRVWSAWGWGTMNSGDFSLVAEDSDRVAEIADAAINALAQSELEAAVNKWPDHWSRAQREREVHELCSQAGLDPVQRKRLCRDARDGMPLQVIHDLIAAELEEAKGDESAVAKTVLPVFSDEEIDELWDQEGGYFALYEGVRRFARALIPLVCKAS